MILIIPNANNFKIDLFDPEEGSPVEWWLKYWIATS